MASSTNLARRSESSLGHTCEGEDGGDQSCGEYATDLIWIDLNTRSGQEVCDVEVSTPDCGHSNGTFVLDRCTRIYLHPNIKLWIRSARLGRTIAKWQELYRCRSVTCSPVEVAEKIAPEVAFNDFLRRKVCLDVRALEIGLSSDLAMRKGQYGEKWHKVFHDA